MRRIGRLQGAGHVAVGDVLLGPAQYSIDILHAFAFGVREARGSISADRAVLEQIYLKQPVELRLLSGDRLKIYIPTCKAANGLATLLVSGAIPGF